MGYSDSQPPLNVPVLPQNLPIVQRKKKKARSPLAGQKQILNSDKDILQSDRTAESMKNSKGDGVKNALMKNMPDKLKLDTDLLSASNIEKAMTYSSLPLSTPNNAGGMVSIENLPTGKTGSINFGKAMRPEKTSLADTDDLIKSCLRNDSRYLKTMKQQAHDT